jgi:predicted alpha/beta-fold hydrolase
MTLMPRWWPRGKIPLGMPTEHRTFQVTQETKLLTKCHWQPPPRNTPTVLLIHGLEGCTESHYMVGLAYKIWAKGWNCIRINQRNCGGSEHLTPTLYHNGLSCDYSQIIQEITERDGCQNIWVIGYSMGGNLTLKLAGEMGDALPSLQGVAAVSPNIHPASCVRALQRPTNWIYHHHFLRSLKTKLKRKNQLYPGKWDLSQLPAIRTMWEFDDVYTAPDGGYRNANDYYAKSAAENTFGAISIPTLIITAQDDPFIPYEIFQHSSLHHNSLIELLAPFHGGHCGFFQRHQTAEDPFWAENRIIAWIQHQIVS